MSKRGEPADEVSWERRVYRNTYTRRGERREVGGWSVKLQWRGERRTLRLRAREREQAAREAQDLFRELRRGGWAAVEVYRAGSWPVSWVTGRGGVEVETGAIGLRKYVSDLNPGFERELFVELTREGTVEQVALGTERREEAMLRAREVRRELEEGGWERIRMGWPREVTVAVFWQANPMTCTYTTFLSSPAHGVAVGVGGGGSGSGRGWRVLVIEPDGSVRRALVGWLSQGRGVEMVRGVEEVPASGRGEEWHILLASQDQALAELRSYASRSGPGGGASRLLTHGVYRDSDAIFASVSGVTRGYFLRRVRPPALLEPLVSSPMDAAVVGTEADRQILRYFQTCLEPETGVVESRGALLTSREAEVLESLRRGLADKEVARELGISVWTVHSHLKRIFAKYGVRTRTEAVVRHLEK